jgi:hypothetical protein
MPRSPLETKHSLIIFSLDPTEAVVTQGDYTPIVQSLVQKLLIQFRMYLGQSIRAAAEGDFEISVVSGDTAPDNKWFGVATYDTEVRSGVAETRIDTIASAGGNWGSSLLSHIADKTVQTAVANKADSAFITLNSVNDPNALNFYTKQGFVDLETGGAPSAKGGLLILRVM